MLCQNQISTTSDITYRFQFFKYFDFLYTHPSSSFTSYSRSIQTILYLCFFYFFSSSSSFRNLATFRAFRAFPKFIVLFYWRFYNWILLNKKKNKSKILNSEKHLFNHTWLPRRRHACWPIWICKWNSSFLEVSSAW